MEARTHMNRKSMRMLTVAGVTLGAMVLSACNPTLRTHGYRYTDGEVPEIQVGEDTEATLLATLGSPSVRGTFEDNTWYYITDTREYLSYLRPTTLARRVIAVQFDAEGVVSEVTEFDASDSRDVNYVSRTTPTRGRELTLLEQVLGNVGRLPADQLGQQENLPGGAGGPRRDD